MLVEQLENCLVCFVAPLIQLVCFINANVWQLNFEI